MKNGDDIFKKYEYKNDDFVATEEDLLAITGQIETVKNNDKKPDIEVLKDDSIAKSDLIQSTSSGQDLKTDYNYIRNNLYTITEKSIDALNSLVDIAQQSQHPRAYEVISLMVNTIASAQKDLMSIHKDKNKIEQDSNSEKSSEVVNNNLFIGNTAQLDEIIANMTKKKLA